MDKTYKLVNLELEERFLYAYLKDKQYIKARKMLLIIIEKLSDNIIKNHCD